ncbi:MAG: hypothetical protein COV72_06850 [Candidatus Omnitrophica bacterium CG11_big_fil_rev_8_21_14_0_20_42_13]|uniref:Response regulatory domain-containing protein n=1 Tax=Candidatus Ghiorseimicrobium undicola TaxID=1974746 RepID=A0A2H0LWE6_9BACT|nr:MAG: hypothetical protein COV72_06850 [Candidatus Omnitrophica bacterium CG11_big_fil_rev_8_21_14_0_20_42_13]
MGIKIMVIDKDKKLLNWLSETLALAGYEAYTCTDEDSSIEKVFQLKPDLILLGFNKPAKSGFFLASELRLSAEHIPVIAMTSFYNKAECLKLIEVCNVRRCLLKPFNPLDVITIIENFSQLTESALREERLVLAEAHIS